MYPIFLTVTMYPKPMTPTDHFSTSGVLTGKATTTPEPSPSGSMSVIAMLRQLSRTSQLTAR